MKVSPKDIKSIGLTVLYDPDNPSDAVADVVLIHGLGGHPVKSWKWTGTLEPPQTPKSSRSGTGSFKRLLKRDATLRRSNSEPLLVLGTKQDSTGRSRNVLRKNSLRPTPRSRLNTGLGDLVDGNEGEVYWPLDLLPRSCPNSRICVWGFHTLLRDGLPLRLQDDVLSHARELLLDLVEARKATYTSDRPIIFVAHSTGGILVKEVLRLCEEEGNGPVRSILLSTATVIFLGCPHRGSKHGTLGDAVRSMASMTLSVDSRDPLLWDLSGSASLKFEIGRQAFVRLWNDYNFKVKTYQESMVSPADFLEIRAEAAVRRQSSFIGIGRESAETIAASHVDMCRFGSAEDSGYQSLATSIARYIRVEGNSSHKITDREKECLVALTRGQLPSCEPHTGAVTYPGTCLWLYDLPEFQAWYHKTDGYQNKVLWIRGQSGSGKSMLLRALRNRIEKQWSPAGGSIIWTKAGEHGTTDIFAPATSGQHFQTEPSCVYRSLLVQLFPQVPHLRKALLGLYEKQRETSTAPLDDPSIVSFFVDDYVDSIIDTPSRRTFIFVDLSDTCGPSYLGEVLSHLSQLARNSDFSICLASGNLLEGVLSEEPIEVLIQHGNADDVLRYVNITLIAEWEERNRTVVRIGHKARGVFLWAKIVVNILNAAIGEGASQDMIEYTLEEMPDDLHDLYEWMLNTLNDRGKGEALVLFQWVVLAAEPLCLNDLLVAVRLTKTWSPAEAFSPHMALELDAPSSMHELRKIRNSEVTTDNPHQFNRWIRARSVGLLELRPSEQQSSPNAIVKESFGLQRVQVTHDSVRSFFLSGRGFACLSPPPSTNGRQLSRFDLIDRAHYSLLHACLTYLNMRDFEPLASSHHAYPAPVSPAESTNRSRQRTVRTQRALVTASYPFLRYAVGNLLIHLLCPAEFRYFLPQTQLLRTLAENRCRLWRRWTSLLGCAEPAAVLRLHDDGPAGRLLSPVFGARFRLERVFRTLTRMAAAAAGQQPSSGRARAGLGVGVPSPVPLRTQPRGKGRAAGSVRRDVAAENVKERNELGGSLRSPRSKKDAANSPRSEDRAMTVPLRLDKGKMPLSLEWADSTTRKATAVSYLWHQDDEETETASPLSPGSDYTSHYSSEVLSGYSTHYSDQALSGYSSGYSSPSKRSPLRPDTFQALEGGLDARLEVGFGMAKLV